MTVVNNRFTTARLRLEREWRIWNLNRQVKAHSQPDPNKRPVVLFNASSRLSGFSQNAAFTLLTGWGLQLADVPVVHFACRAGMSHCVLGTNPDDLTQTPPCDACIAQTKKLTAATRIQWFEFQYDPKLADELEELNLEELSLFEFSSWPVDRGQSLSIPLGMLVLPSLRWTLRRHHLSNDDSTRYLMRMYIQSAFRVIVEFFALLKAIDPHAVVVFNGLQFPEAAARWVAIQQGIPVFTHEVGFQPFSAAFSEGQITAYPLEIPDEFELSPDQHAQIDALLSRRFQGEFTMAGITFWPEMKGLSEDFLQYASDFKQIVPIFTNVIFDTSQVHANTVYPHMFAWLDLLLDVIKNHPETLFVIRAHPDEMREGKKSRESVQEWVTAKGVEQLPQVIFVPSDGPLSSYDLIHRSKFVMVYNSSIGLEAALLGSPVLCGGRARYTQYPTVFFPQTPDEYKEMAEQFLAAEIIEIPSEFQPNARRVLYHQFYRSALMLGTYLEAHPTPGYVQLRRFSWHALRMENSLTMQVIVDGINSGEPFLMPFENGHLSLTHKQ